MATGIQPFQGNTSAALFNEILNKAPTAPGDYPRGLMKADVLGQHAVELLKELMILPIVTPDGRQIMFVRVSDGNQTLWTIPIDGGTPTHFTNDFSTGADISPDGKSILIRSWNEQKRGAMFICDLPGCTNRRSLPYLENAKWMPDGRSVAGLTVVTPRSNLWAQPFDGKPAHQLTHFTDPRTIIDFAWSRDGKRLAIARTTSTSDIVLFKGLKK